MSNSDRKVKQKGRREKVGEKEGDSGRLREGERGSREREKGRGGDRKRKRERNRKEEKARNEGSVNVTWESDTGNRIPHIKN